MRRVFGVGFGFTVGTAALAASCARGSAPPAGEPGEPATPFAVASVHFERNATDGDVEVVFEAKGGDDGLTSFSVTAPDGRTVVSATSADTCTMGVRQYRFESPEPTDTARLQTAYPEGAYRFAGTTATGGRYASEATLSHRLPATATVLTPVDEAEDVPVAGLRLTWTGAGDAVAYVVTIEQPTLGFELTVTLPGAATSFAVPNGVLQPGHEYTLAVGAVLPGGNASFVETSFTTSGTD